MPGCLNRILSATALAWCVMYCSRCNVSSLTTRAAFPETPCFCRKRGAAACLLTVRLRGGQGDEPVRNVGVGIGLSKSGAGGHVVRRLTPGFPAEACGHISAKDVLLAIDGVTVDGVDTFEVMKKLRGRVGTNVELLLQRAQPAGESVTFSVTLTRERASPADEAATKLENSVEQSACAAAAAQHDQEITAVKAQEASLGDANGIELRHAQPVATVVAPLATEQHNAVEAPAEAAQPTQQCPKTVGIGLTEKTAGICTVAKLLPGSAAAAAGTLVVGDVVVDVAGTDVRGLPKSEVRQCLAERLCHCHVGRRPVWTGQRSSLHHPA